MGSTDVISWQIALTGSILTTGGTFLGTTIVESDLSTVLAAVLSAAIAGQSADAFSVGSANAQSQIDWDAVGVIFGIESIYNFLVLISISIALMSQKKYNKTKLSKKVSLRQLLGILVFLITITVFFSLTAAFQKWDNWWVRFLVVIIVGAVIFAITYLLEISAFRKYFEVV